MEVDLERLNSPPGEGGYKNTHPLEEVVKNYIPHLERWCGKNTQALGTLRENEFIYTYIIYV